MAESLLDVPLMNQELSRWCWAAVASALSVVIPGPRGPMAPCAIATGLLSGDCCHAPDPCNTAQDVRRALEVVGIACRDVGISFAAIKDDIVNRVRPLVARIEDFESFQHHYIIVVGCDGTTNTDGTVVCADPNGPRGYHAQRYRMRYSDLEVRYGGWGRCVNLYSIEP